PQTSTLSLHDALPISSNQPGSLPEMPQPEFKFKIPAVLASTPLVTASTLRLSGDLANRHLLVAPELRSWPSAEILSNSVVQLLVDRKSTRLNSSHDQI